MKEIWQKIQAFRRPQAPTPRQVVEDFTRFYRQKREGDYAALAVKDLFEKHAPATLSRAELAERERYIIRSLVQKPAHQPLLQHLAWALEGNHECVWKTLTLDNFVNCILDSLPSQETKGGYDSAANTALHAIFQEHFPAKSIAQSTYERLLDLLMVWTVDRDQQQYKMNVFNAFKKSGLQVVRVDNEEALVKRMQSLGFQEAFIPVLSDFPSVDKTQFFITIFSSPNNKDAREKLLESLSPSDMREVAKKLVVKEREHFAFTGLPAKNVFATQFLELLIDELMQQKQYERVRGITTFGYGHDLSAETAEQLLSKGVYTLDMLPVGNFTKLSVSLAERMLAHSPGAARLVQGFSPHFEKLPAHMAYAFVQGEFPSFTFDQYFAAEHFEGVDDRKFLRLALESAGPYKLLAETYEGSLKRVSYDLLIEEVTRLGTVPELIPVLEHYHKKGLPKNASNIFNSMFLDVHLLPKFSLTFWKKVLALKLKDSEPDSEQEFNALRFINSNIGMVHEGVNVVQETLGAFASYRLYQLARPEKEERTKKGYKEMKETLKKKLELVRAALFDNDAGKIRALTDDKVALYALKAYVRYEASSWGSHDETDLVMSLLKIAGRIQKGEKIFADEPKELSVRGLRKTENTTTAYSHVFMDKFTRVRNAIVEAQRNREDPEFIGSLIKRLEASLREKLERIDNSTQEHQTRQVRDKEALTRALAPFQEGGSITARSLSEAFAGIHKKLSREDEMTLLTLLLIPVMKPPVKGSENPAEIDWSMVSLANVARDDISRMMDLLTHVTFEEFYAKAVTEGELETAHAFEEKSLKLLRRVFNVQALEEGLASSGGVAGEREKLIVQHARNVLTELSGHMGDACYASRQEILERENISSLTFTDASGKVLGSSLLIRAQNKNKAKPGYLVVRGLNPLESYINGVDVPSFTNAVFAYVKEIAEREGLEPAIVIDSVGRASTNRPALFLHLDKLSKQMKKVSTGELDDRETEFNSYHITKDIYKI